MSRRSLRRTVGWGGALALAAAALMLGGGDAGRRPEPSPSLGSLSPAERALVRKARAPRYPNTWFLRQRMSGDPIPVRARQEALRKLRGQAGPESGSSGSAGAEEGGGALSQAPGSWVLQGPDNIGGRITALAVDPNDETRLWVGAAAGGVWRSEDGGATWVSVWDDIVSQSIGAMAAHPTDSNILYVGTGEDNGGGYSYDGDGIYKTTDGGQSWQHLGLAETRRIGGIAVDPVNPQRVFVAAGGNVFGADANRGVYRSTDGGQTWQQVLFVDNETGANEVAVDPANPNRVYAAFWHRIGDASGISFGGPSGGIWISDDGGDTWTRQTSTGLPATDLGRIGLAIAPSNPSVVYARYQNASGSYKGLWKSVDGGVSWFQVDSGGGIWRFFLASYGYYFGEVRVDPQDPDHVFLLDVNWFESFNGGQSFNVESGMHVDHHDMYIGTSRWYMGNDGGLYWSTDLGASWIHSTTLPISQAYDIAIAELDPLRRFMGLQDNGTVRTTTGGFSDWHEVLGGDGLQCEVDPTDVLLVYASSQGGNINRSTDGGDTFQNGTNGIQNERTNWNAPVTHDPVTSQRLYTGTFRVYRTTDGAQNWTPISPDLTNGPPAGASATGFHDSEAPIGRSHLEDVVRGTVTTIGVSPVDPTILWAGTDDGNVWVSDDDGATWTQVNVPGRTEWVTRVTADPFQAQTAYVTFSGFRNNSRMPHVFRTTDLGQTWEDISGDLPEVPLNDVVADPDWEGRLFVASDLGVYVTDSWGQAWQDMNGGMPLLVVHDLVLHDPTRTLYAGTHARSLWSFDLDQLPIPDRDLDGVDNLADCAPDDPGAFAAPGEVTGLRFDTKDSLVWDSAQPGAGSGTVHDVMRGDLSDLPVGGTSETCLVSGTPDASATDASPVPPGEGRRYLVRARNVCGTGTYGTDSAGAERVSAACP